MEKLNQKTIATAVKRYNKIMFSICREHLTINTDFSEGTDNWNLRDLVSEMQYTLDIWQDQTCMPWLDAHYEKQPRYNHSCGDWLYNYRLEVAKMKRFINTYKNYIDDLECIEDHCSIYD